MSNSISQSLCDTAARRLTAAAFLAVVAMGSAQAQGRLEARYSISVAGVSIGQAEWTTDVGRDKYSSQASGRASGILSVIVSGEGTASARGAVRAGQFVPTEFTTRLTQEDYTSGARMVLDNGDVKDVKAEASKHSPDRVPVTAAHRHGIIDPVSALLVPMPGAFDEVRREACQRTLPVFDGRRRFDLKLSFKRMHTVKSDKGYSGPVAVCAVTFMPVAGHRASSTLVKYLTDGRAIELWLAPVPAVRLLAPYRASVASMLGNLVIEATQFDVSVRSAAKSAK